MGLADLFFVIAGQPGNLILQRSELAAVNAVEAIYAAAVIYLML